MSLNAKQAASGGRDIEPMAQGTYPARLVMVAELGLQTQRPYQGQAKDPAVEIALTWEFVDEFMKDEDGNDDPAKPRWLTETMRYYNLDADKATSTKRYLALDPQIQHEGYWDRLLDTPAMVTVVHNPNKKKPGSVYENIDSVQTMRDKDALRCPALVNAPRAFDFDDPDLETFLALPKFLQKKIKDALNYKGSAVEAMLEAAGDPTPEKEETAAAEEKPAENPY